KEMAEPVARFGDAYDAGVLQCAGDYLRQVAHRGHIPELGQDTLPLSRGLVIGRAVLDQTIIQVPDLQAETEEYPLGSENARRLGHRTILAVPLIRDREAIGAIFVRRTEVRPFAGRPIELPKTSADQAVIAMENARQLGELRDSLDQQTATADILRVIAGTPGDSKRALDTIAETAVRIFNAASVNFRRIEGNILRIFGTAGPPSTAESLLDIPLEPTDPPVRCLLDNRQIPPLDSSVSGQS